MKSENKTSDHAAPPVVGPRGVTTHRGAYNLISDTVIGVNYRWRDNFIQAVFVLVFAISGAAVCGWMGRQQGNFKEGLMIGTVIGLIVGVVLTGVAIMIFRAIRHLMGRHD